MTEKRHGNVKDFCKRGHELAVHARVYVRPYDGTVQRQCRKCEAILRYVRARLPKQDNNGHPLETRK